MTLKNPQSFNQNKNINKNQQKSHNYDQDAIKSMDWCEHIRLRPGMYIGKLGTGTESDDGLYILIKETVDNAIDEFIMGFGKLISIAINDNKIIIRDYGRGIPLERVYNCVAKINTGAKYGSNAFSRSVGLNGVGLKAVNALSSFFEVISIRQNKQKKVTFSKGKLVNDHDITRCDEKDGTKITFIPDKNIFGNYQLKNQFIEDLISNYAYLNTNLTLKFNNKKFLSKHGLKDFVSAKLSESECLYPIIHFKNSDIELALTHLDDHNGEIVYGFVNGQYTPMAGTHIQGFRDVYIKTIRNFYNKKFDAQDIKNGMFGALSVRLNEPVFESQTKTKLGSTEIKELNISLKAWIDNNLGKYLDLLLHQNKELADTLLAKIKKSQQDRVQINKLTKSTKERIKKSDLFNKKLRDCKIHLNSAHKEKNKSMIFITEGDSASGSITKSRNPKHQAVFSLRGKPMNCYGYNKKSLYENEELYLLTHACGLSDNLDSLRFNKIVMATDADVDGMHIRLLLLTFFLYFFSDVVMNGNLYVLDTPLFRVRNKKQTVYCYSDQEKLAVEKKLSKPEVTRFKGLGEISPDEFGLFIGPKMKLSRVSYSQKDNLPNLLKFYMGTNTDNRKNFIINNI